MQIHLIQIKQQQNIIEIDFHRGNPRSIYVYVPQLISRAALLCLCYRKIVIKKVIAFAIMVTINKLISLCIGIYMNAVHKFNSTAQYGLCAH